MDAASTASVGDQPCGEPLSGFAGSVLGPRLRGASEVLDASPYDAYICGQPEMCESVSTLLLAKGIPENRIFRDDFFAAA